LSPFIADCDTTTLFMESAGWKIAGLQVDRTPACRTLGRYVDNNSTPTMGHNIFF
jgi:hypothetical protein